jgi:cytochrome P450
MTGATHTPAAKRPPGPRGHWLGGHLPDFRRGRLDFFTRCARDYGDFVSLRFGPKRILLVSDPEAIDYVLSTGSRHFSKHFALRLNPIILGNGLLTSEGDFWLRQRRLAQPAFQRQRIAAYGPVMVEHAERLLAGWRDGDTRDILAEMMRLTLGIAAKTLFGADSVGQAEQVSAALRVAQDAFIARFNRMVPIPMLLPTPGNLRLRRAVRQLDAVIYDFIRQRRAAGPESSGASDLLSLLLHARDEDGQGQMTDKQLRDEAMTLFLAGHETTALTLAWAWYLLAEHPEAEAKLLAEVQAALGGRSPTADDLPRLPYAEAVILETMRLYPPGYVIGREALHDCAVGGYHVPAGLTLLMSPWVLHRDARFFDRPEEFRPERWDNDLLKRLPRVVYFPFGAGPRRCIGDAFAMIETVLVLATVAPRYPFLLFPGQEVVPWPTFTLRPKNGIKVILKRR